MQTGGFTVDSRAIAVISSVNAVSSLAFRVFAWVFRMLIFTKLANTLPFAPENSGKSDNFAVFG